MLQDIDYLIYRKHITVTFKLIHITPDVPIAIARLYVLPADLEDDVFIREMRKTCCGCARYESWHDKKHGLIMNRLFEILDYSIEASKIENKRQLIQYLANNSAMIFNGLRDYQKFKLDEIGTNDYFSHTKKKDLNFHLDRMSKRKGLSFDEDFNEAIISATNNSNSYKTITPAKQKRRRGNPNLWKFKAEDNQKEVKQENELSLTNRLLKIYNTVKTSFDVEKINLDEELKFKILKNDVPGLKNTLYRYQCETVLKMIDREINSKTRLRTNLVEIGNNKICRTSSRETLKPFFFDIQKLEFRQKSLLFKTPRGGILAENMGLGKTFICLALICITKLQITEIPKELRETKLYDPKCLKLIDYSIRHINRNSISWKEYADSFPTSCIKLLKSRAAYFEIDKNVSNVESLNESEPKGYRRNLRIKESPSKKNKIRLHLCSTTLLVVPDNLAPQWKAEIKKHIIPGYLKVIEILDFKSEIPKIEMLIQADVVLMSLGAFSNQAKYEDSNLRKLYWKRLIIDEGHRMNSKDARAVTLANELYIERKWAISGTPTAGLTELHMTQEADGEPYEADPKTKKKTQKGNNNKRKKETVVDLESNIPSPPSSSGSPGTETPSEEYMVKRRFNVRDDLIKLGLIISNFLKVEPWTGDPKLWSATVIKPFLANSYNCDLQLTSILDSLIIRHDVVEVEKDIQLPKLYHKAVFLEPSFFDRLSINLFISVLAVNAVTSERVDKDYMFHASNKGELKRLITNLQRATFYWTGFSINDIDTLLSICNYAMSQKDKKYSRSDTKLLEKSIFIAKTALSNTIWRTCTTIHEMSYYVENLPPVFTKMFSIGIFKNRLDRNFNPVAIYSAPQLLSIQKFFFKNRFIGSNKLLDSKLDEFSKTSWKRYWNEAKKKGSHLQKGKNQRGDTVDLDLLHIIDEKPDWYSEFDSFRDEKKIMGFKTEEEKETEKNSKKKQKKKLVGYTKRTKMEEKKSLIVTLKLPKSKVIRDKSLNSEFRKAKLIGTASAKLAYLTGRLFEHQYEGIKSIVFFEFEDSAYYLTEMLDILGINYLIYATFIKLADRSSNLLNFSGWDTKKRGGVTLIVDIKLAAFGLTIIEATRVYFINPIWRKEIEAQAIKRAHRIGQTQDVHVEIIMLKNTIEEEMYYKKQEAVRNEEEQQSTMIDDTGMQNYIMRYDFLPMYNSKEYEEIKAFGVSGNDVCIGYNKYDEVDLANLRDVNGEEKEDDNKPIKKKRKVNKEVNFKPDRFTRSKAKLEQENGGTVVDDDSSMKEDESNDVLDFSKIDQGSEGLIIHHKRDYNNEYLRDDKISLLQPIGKLDKRNNVMYWELPLFTERRLERMNEHSKSNNLKNRITDVTLGNYGIEKDEQETNRYVPAGNGASNHIQDYKYDEETDEIPDELDHMSGKSRPSILRKIKRKDRIEKFKNVEFKITESKKVRFQ
ncbi:hypothetical protein B5S33_g2027 [[Candida] boidinii]|nr:hypothetical protein B5S30_g2865 [[Candida] boidinii]OWB83398.1 hypothetical protein B5S33_g2027 [[Candida] boidinii]